jgi:hypothetical protein
MLTKISSSNHPAKKTFRLAKLYKKLHKWPGLILSFILLYYGVTGVFMNHREFFSGIDISRSILPANYHYNNWNNAALKGNVIINNDSLLFYGNIGVWLTDSSFRNFQSLNAGFPSGMDNRKIYDLHICSKGNLYAATHFGLFAFDIKTKLWRNIPLDVDIKRFVAIESVQDTLYVLNRSFLFKGKSNGLETKFVKIELKSSESCVNKVTLFETMWQIHSGEIFGIPGKLIVDAFGLITIFLSLTGIIYFFFPGWIKRRKRNKKTFQKIKAINKWSLKWHNEIGAWTFVLLVILYFTGMFLRPPLLITIANSMVKPLKYTHLDQPNPWYDELRDLLYNPYQDIFILSTSAGTFYMDKNTLAPKAFQSQPPVSVMGINTLEKFDKTTYIIGSFSGLFLWDPNNSKIYNYTNQKLYSGDSSGQPVGEFSVTGTIKDNSGNYYLVDYNKGVIPLYHQNHFPKMPDNILKESKISVWNFSLELHTGRFFQFLIGGFYILIVPLTGLSGIIIVISGYLLYRKKYRNKDS